MLERILETYGDKVRLVYRHFPLGEGTLGWRVAEAARCAGAQGKFWEYHDVLYEGPGPMDDAALMEHAGKIGLDEGAFAACLASGHFAEEVQAEREEGLEAGVGGTPAFFINGRDAGAYKPYDAFKQLIDEELARLGLL